jgi:Chaperone of endosialidase
MTAQLAPNPVFRATDGNGAPLFQGQLFTYGAGTTTPQATYVDSTQTTPNLNPVILNARGECPLWLDPTKSYKFDLFDKNGNHIPGWPVDNVSGGSLSGSVIPTVANLFTLGNPTFPFANLYLGANAAPVLDTGTGNIGYYARTAVENAVGVVPTTPSYMPLDPRRYDTIAHWSLVYGAVSAEVDTYWPFYRGDHAQHPALTNAIAGYKSYDDSQKTGTVGYRTTVFGAQAMQQNGGSVTAGGSNSAFGFAALETSVEGSGNSCFGALSLNSLTGLASSHNNAFGYRSLTLLVNGTQNEVFGFQGVNSLITGQNNHAFGENVLQGVTVGNGNHHFGYQAGFNKGVGDFSHAFGYQALTQENQGTITAITLAASAVVTISMVSVANPFAVNCPVSFEGVGGTTQINGLFGTVTAVGGSSGAWTITVNINSTGFSAFTSGGAIFPLGNSAFGYQAGSTLNCGGANTLVGWQAGQANPVDVGNTAVGYQAGLKLSTGGALNTAVGYQALINNLGGPNNTCVGFSAGAGINSGGQNICIGDSSGGGISSSSQSVAVGSATLTNLNGAANTAVGFNAGSQGSAQTFTNTASFGQSATPTASNQVTLGNASIATLRCQQTTITALSDARFKTEIDDLAIPDGFLDEVRTVTFKWLDPTMPPGTQVGVIAQELDALQIKYDVEWLGLVDHTNPERLEATPHKLLFPLISAFQKQHARLDEIERKLAFLGV